MKRWQGIWRSGRLPWVVFLAYALPVLLFADKNSHAIYYGDAAGLLLGSLLLGALIWCVARLIYADWLRSAVFATVFAFFALRFNDWFHLADSVLDNLADPHTLAYVMFLVSLPVFYWLIRRASRSLLETLLDYVAVVGSLVALYAFGHITAGALADAKIEVKPAHDITRGTQHRPGQDPDIYYLVFEDYAGPVAQKETFHFDPAPFNRQARQRGLYVADQSYSNYPSTIPSMASSLSGSLLQLSGPYRTSVSSKPLLPLYREPAVATFLKDRGYQFTQVGSWWLIGKSGYADDNPQHGWAVRVFGHDFHLGYFKGTFLLGTVFGDFYDYHGPTEFSPRKSHRDIFLTQMADIERQAKSGGSPKFVMSQLMLPHHPYVFAADGSSPATKKPENQAYVAQIQYVNKRMLQLIDRLKAAYPKDNQPVIVISSDEGTYPEGTDGSEVKVTAQNSSDKVLRLKNNIPGLFYFSDGDYSSLYPTITPANILRVVFNKYLDAGLKLEPDTIYAYGSEDHWLDYVDVTKRVRGK